jgi:hypothetical protein
MAFLKHPAPMLFALLSVPLFGGCAMDNPAFDGLAEETSRGEAHDDHGDGDGDPNPGDGDGDAESSSTGDGDGDAESSTGDGDPIPGDGDGDPFACPEGLELCDGVCVHLGTNNSSCGTCGNICAADNLCALGNCAPIRYVFTSSVKLFGDFNSVSAVDSVCNDLAGTAQLPGIYKAWISDAQQSPTETFAPSEGVYILPDGPIVAYTIEQLFSGQIASPINRNEFGFGIDPTPADGCGLDFAVWTGTTNTGLPAQPYCDGWTTANGNTLGIVGDAMSKYAWSNTECAASCSMALPVYCVQQ